MTPLINTSSKTLRPLTSMVVLGTGIGPKREAAKGLVRLIEEKVTNWDLKAGGPCHQ